MTRIGDVISVMGPGLDRLGRQGSWYSIGEHAVAPYVDATGAGVSFVPWFRGKKATGSHGENRAWLVIESPDADGQAVGLARPASNRPPAPQEIRVTSHRGCHTVGETQTCWFLREDRYCLIPGLLVSIPAELLGARAFQCREPRFDDVVGRLTALLAASCHRPAGRRERPRESTNRARGRIDPAPPAHGVEPGANQLA